jgi:hypothetical protein
LPQNSRNYFFVRSCASLDRTRRNTKITSGAFEKTSRNYRGEGVD